MQLATTDMGRKLGAVPTMWPGSRPTCMLSFIFIHRPFGHIHQRYRQTGQWSDSIVSVAQKSRFPAVFRHTSWRWTLSLLFSPPINSLLGLHFLPSPSPFISSLTTIFPLFSSPPWLALSFPPNSLPYPHMPSLISSPFLFPCPIHSLSSISLPSQFKIWDGHPAGHAATGSYCLRFLVRFIYVFV